MGNEYKSRVQRQVIITEELISSNQKKVNKYVDGYYQRFMALTRMDRNKSDKRYAIGNAALNVPIAAVSFIPIYGPVAGAILSAAVNCAGAGQKAVGMLSAAIKFNLNAREGMDATSYSNIGVLVFNPAKSQINQALSKGLNDTVAASCNILAPIFFPNKGRGGKGFIVNLQSTSNIMGDTLSIMQSQIADAYKLEVMNLKNKKNAGFVHLLFYYMLKDQNVGGQGSLLLDSGITLDDADFEKLKTLKQIQEAFAKEKGNRIARKIAKYKDNAYDCLFSQKTDIQEQLISRVAVHKIKLFAYAEDYIKLLSRVFGDKTISFLKGNDGVCEKGKTDRPLPYFFHASGEGKLGSMGHGHYKTAHYKDANRSTARKNYVLGVFSFYAMLENHVGTFNLAGLPPLGANDKVDQAVLRGLIDGLVTQYWLTAMAYSVSSARSVPDTLKDNLLSKKALQSMSNISVFFDPERFWKAQGQNLCLIAGSAEEENWAEYIDKTKMTNLNLLVGQIDNSIVDGESQLKVFTDQWDMLIKEERNSDIDIQLYELKKKLDNKKLELSKHKDKRFASDNHITYVKAQNDIVIKAVGDLKSSLKNGNFIENKFPGLSDVTIRNLIPTNHNIDQSGNYYTAIKDLIIHSYLDQIADVPDTDAILYIHNGYKEQALKPSKFTIQELDNKPNEDYPIKGQGQLGSENLKQKLDAINIGGNAGDAVKLKESIGDAYTHALLSMKNTDPLVQADFNKSVVKSLMEIMKLIK